MENIDKKQTSCTEKHLRHIALSGQKRGCFCTKNEGNENKNFHFHKNETQCRRAEKTVLQKHLFSGKNVSAIL